MNEKKSTRKSKKVNTEAEEQIVENTIDKALNKTIKKKPNKFLNKYLSSRKFQFRLVLVILGLLTFVTFLIGFLNDSISSFVVGMSVLFLGYIFFCYYRIREEKNKKKLSIADEKEKKEESLPFVFTFAIIIICAVALLLFNYYIVLPPLSIQDSSFIWYLVVVLFIFSQIIVYLIYKIIVFVKKKKLNLYRLEFIVGVSVIGSVILSSIVGAATSLEMFRAKDYAKLLDIEYIRDSEALAKDFALEADDIILPTIDKDIAYRQAQIALGEYGNQYHIEKNYFSIQCVETAGERRLIRTAPLEYSNTIVSLQNNKKGTPGFVVVDLSTGEVELKTDKRLVYMPSSKLSTDLLRHVRLNNMNLLFDNYYFEIDDDYNPYWIIPCYKKTIGMFGGKKPSSVLTVNANTGDIKKYSIEKAPSWIDNVVDRSIVENLASYALKYKSGYINSTIGAKSGVYIINEGYNFFVKNGESYYVSSVTSRDERDQTSIGFLIINLSTSEAKLYYQNGITEDRAMSIASLDDTVKAMKLDATWPIFITIDNTPSYFLTLKNEVKVQKYVFMDEVDGSNLIIGDSLQEAKEAYIKLLKMNEVEETTFKGTVERATISNDSIYIKLNNSESVFTCPLTFDPRLYILKSGDVIEFNGYDYQDKLSQITSIKSIVLN